MRYLDLVKNIRKNGVIRPQDIAFLANPVTLKPQLSKWKKQGKLLELRKGFYILPPDLHPPPPIFYLANILVFPSYVSLQSALSYYGLIPEAVFSVTSVTSKKTLRFHTPLGSFIYRKIKRELFWGYSRIEVGGFRIFIALAEKALLDTVYITHEGPESLRLQNIEVMDMKRLRDMAKKYPSWVWKRLRSIL